MAAGKRERRKKGAEETRAESEGMATKSTRSHEIGAGSVEVDFGVLADVVLEAAQETGDVDGCGGLRGERLVDE